MATVKRQPQRLTCRYNQMLPHFVRLLGQTDEHNSVSDLGCASDVIDGFKQEGLKQIGWVMHLHKSTSGENHSVVQPATTLFVLCHYVTM